MLSNSFTHVVSTWSADRTSHPILGLAGFRIEHIRWCSMHCVNLGILRHLNGSIIDLLASLGAQEYTHIYLFVLVYLFLVPLHLEMLLGILKQFRANNPGECFILFQQYLSDANLVPEHYI